MFENFNPIELISNTWEFDKFGAILLTTSLLLLSVSALFYIGLLLVLYTENIRKKIWLTLEQHKQRKEKREVQKQKDKDPRHSLWKRLGKEGCIKCGCQNMIEGPKAGLSTNVQCVKCGKKYNLTIVFEFAEEL